MNNLKKAGIIITAIIIILVIGSILKGPYQTTSEPNYEQSVEPKIEKLLPEGYALNKSTLDDKIEFILTPNHYEIQRLDNEICTIYGDEIYAAMYFDAKNEDIKLESRYDNFRYGMTTKLTTYDLAGNVLHESSGHRNIQVPRHEDFASCDVSLIKVFDLECTQQEQFTKSISGYSGNGCDVPKQYWSFECMDEGNDCKNIVYDRP